MRTIFRQLRRAAYGGLALALFSGLAIPALANDVFAYGLPTARSVEMSNSAAGATNTTYTVSFTTATAGIVQAVVINFCDDYPIIGQSCGYTAGQSVSIGSAAITNVTGTNDNTVGASDWKLSANANSATAGNGVILVATNTSGTNTSIVSGHPLTFTFTGITNPNYSSCSNNTSPNCTFYARILTYTTAAGGTGYQSATIGAPTDAGGAAMSTTSTISVTAKVMEQITFCVSGAAPTNCSTGVTSPTITIGNGSGILDTAGVYTSNVFTQTSTNANSGVAVRLKTTSSTTCAGLSSNGGTSCTIPAVASGATTPQTITAGTAAFGMCVTPGTANTTATAPYNNGGCTQYGMDDSSANKTTSTYGSQIFSSTGAINGENDTLKYAATASSTTPAGIYTTNESLIATGTY